MANSKNGARPKKANRLKTKTHLKDDTWMTSIISDLQEFEEFRETILKAIRKDLMSGMDAKQLREKYEAIVQARVLTTAISSPDSQSMSAAKDVLDRSSGRATEKKEIIHRYADMKDEELDAILQSEEMALDNLKNTTEH